MLILHKFPPINFYSLIFIIKNKISYLLQADVLTDVLYEDFVMKGQMGIDIFPYVQRAALDIILETAMGVALGVQTKRQSDYLDQIEEAVQVIQERQFYPWYMSGMVIMVINSILLFWLSPVSVFCDFSLKCMNDRWQG